MRHMAYDISTEIPDSLGSGGIYNLIGINSFILVYMKTYPLQVVQGGLFGMGQSKAHQWIYVLLVVLQPTLRMLGDAASPVLDGIGPAYRGGRGQRDHGGLVTDHVPSARDSASAGTRLP